MTSERDAYEILQVDVSAETGVVRTAYRALARRYHPDGSEPDVRRMAEINQAYDRLRTPERRREYDRNRPLLVGVGPGPGSAASSRWPGPSSAVASGALSRRIAMAERDDSPIIDFGQYAGWRIGDVARHDPAYLRWLSRHSAGVRYGQAIATALGGDREIGRRASLLR